MSIWVLRLSPGGFLSLLTCASLPPLFLPLTENLALQPSSQLCVSYFSCMRKLQGLETCNPVQISLLLLILDPSFLRGSRCIPQVEWAWALESDS